MKRSTQFLAVLFVFLASLANADAPPNVLFAISDDQSFPHASAYGCSFVRTPAFDRVAERGVLFTNAFAASPGCSPSRAAILTGRYPWELEHAGTHASSFSAKFDVFPDLLERAGYAVGFTGKPWGPGNFRDGGRARNPAGPSFNSAKMQGEIPGAISRNDYAANFAEFLKQRKPEQPFCFWFGAYEPHRAFQKGVGVAAGKDPASVEVPGFLPDVPEVRSDLLDYAFEIEWFDGHLGRMLDALEAAGELESTIVVVTSDNGMAFPRAKANNYEYGTHVPLAVSWPRNSPAGRRVEDLVSLIDLAPTFLEGAGLPVPGDMTGRSLVSILTSGRSGVLEPTRRAVFAARERHSSSRYQNRGYPIRSIRTRDYLYIRNYTPERWPAGHPRGQTKRPKDNVDGNRGYFDIDGCPTKTYLVVHRQTPEIAEFFQLAVDKRPAEELFAVSDTANLHNLAESPAHRDVKDSLAEQLYVFLRRTGDPRAGPDGEIFETYKRYSHIRTFPKD